MHFLAKCWVVDFKEGSIVLICLDFGFSTEPAARADEGLGKLLKKPMCLVYGF